MAARKVIVDVDTGTDDALALLLLLAADAAGEVELLAITCVAGNTELRNVRRNTTRLLKAANRLDVPVYAGADTPLLAESSLIVSDHPHHGKDGFGDMEHGDEPDLDGLVQAENAVVALNRLVSANKGEVTLVGLGPLTNIALALRTFPDFGKSLRELHVMGGNVRGIGNISPAAEFNFAFDPEAAHIVLSGVDCPVQMTPWEPCADHPITFEWRFESLPAGGRASAVLSLLSAAERRVLARCGATHWVCCDQLCVAALLRPRVVARSHPRHVAVELQGSRTRGQVVPGCVMRPVAARDACCPADCRGPDADRPRRPVRVLDAFDLDAFKDLLMWAAERWTRPRL